MKEDIRVTRNYIRDVITYLKRGFSLKYGICLVPWYLLRKYNAIRNSQGQIPLPRGKSGKRSELVKKNIPLLSINQKTLFIYKVELYTLNIYSNMTSFKRFGSKPVLKYTYIGISADRQRHNLIWLIKYRICPIRMEIIHGGLNIILILPRVGLLCRYFTPRYCSR